MNKNLESIWSNSMIENKEKKLESISGVGSTLKYTESLRQELPQLLKKFNITSIFDAPCGDMNWMGVFLKENNISYIGGDIVAHVVKDNQKYSNSRTTIIHLDITSSAFPDTDLWFCRDCWFHLPDKHIFASIDRFLESNIKYLLTTTHINTGFVNENISDVGFKLIDLFSSPYSFPEPIARIDDFFGKKTPREMVLFNRDQIITWNALRNAS